MKIPFVKENISANLFHYILDIPRRHMHSFFVIFFVIGMWLTRYPSDFPSLQIIQSYTTKGTFFGPDSYILDYFNGSFVDLLKHQTDLVFATFLYANWDAASIHSRSNIEILQSFSPIDIIAIDCWHPNSSCNAMLQIKRYPQLLFQFGKSLRVFYKGPLLVPHICEYFSFLLYPVEIIRSNSDLTRLLVTKKFVIIGYFSQATKHRGYHSFYRTALQFHSLRTDESSSFGLYPLQDVVFAVDLRKPSFIEPELSLITFYTPCNGSVRGHTVRMITTETETSAWLKGELLDLINKARQSWLSCLYPTDITLTESRSSLLTSVFASSPVLLIVGPRLSLTKHSDPEGYLFYSLRLAYTSCNSSTETPPEPHMNLTESQDLLYQTSIEADRQHTMLASMCPRWWSGFARTLGLDSSQLCGSQLLQGVNATASNSRQPPIKRLLAYIRKRSVDSQFLLDLASSLFSQLERGQIENSREFTSYQGSDGPFLVERLHFLCCHWYHRNQDSAGRPLERRRHLATAPVTSRRSRLVDGPGGGCHLPSNNRSLQFHLLDSELQPELAWRLAGHEPAAGQLTAVVVDLQEESVYRLEEQVNYDTLSDFISNFHASSLKPWRKYDLQKADVLSRREGHPGPSVGQSNRLVIIDSATQLTALLDARTSIRLRRDHNQQHWQQGRAYEASTNLVLLYHSRGCMHSAKGQGLLLHFHAASRYLSNRSDLLFAVVDVSVVDLPWERRVERIPAVLFFPANASSYSSVFPHTYHLGDNILHQLVSFILKQSSGAHVDTPQAEAPSAVVPSRLLASVLPVWLGQDERGEEELTAVLARCQEFGEKTRLACLRAIRTDLRASSQAFQVARLAALQAVVGVEQRLHRINNELLARRWHPFHTGASLAGKVRQLSLYSTSWRALSTHVHWLDGRLTACTDLLTRLVV